MYEIIIKEIRTEKRTKKGPWSVIEKRPFTDAELNESKEFWAVVEKREANTMKEIMGYAPDWESVDTIESEILRQRVPSMNLNAVIKAINGLP